MCVLSDMHVVTRGQDLLALSEHLRLYQDFYGVLV